MEEFLEINTTLNYFRILDVISNLKNNEESIAETSKALSFNATNQKHDSNWFKVELTCLLNPSVCHICKTEVAVNYCACCFNSMCQEHSIDGTCNDCYYTPDGPWCHEIKKFHDTCIDCDLLIHLHFTCGCKILQGMKCEMCLSTYCPSCLSKDAYCHRCDWD